MDSTTGGDILLSSVVWVEKMFSRLGPRALRPTCTKSGALMCLHGQSAVAVGA